MRKIFLINFLLFAILLPGLSQAAIVTCGPGTAKSACEFCDIFIMGSGILEWIFTRVVPTVAALMFIIGGMMFLFAGAKADMLNKAKGVITAAVIGMLIIFGAWVIVNTVFSKIGVIELSPGWHWYDIQCKTP